MKNLELLRSIGRVEKFSKDDIICMEDEPGEDMYIVLAGELGVYIDSFADFPQLVTIVGQNSFFGELSVIDGSPRSATIKAETDGAILAISREKFPMLLEKCPDIADSIMNTLYSRAEAAAEAARISGKYSPPVPSAVNSGDAESKLNTMKAIAQYIRQSNSILYEPAVPPEGILKLLPEGYTLFNKSDEYDNTGNLCEKRVTCPFCLKKFDEFIPYIANLNQIYTNLDGRAIYSGFNILLYTHIVCSNCNYTDSYREFSKIKPDSKVPRYKENQFKNSEFFTGFANKYNHTYDEAILSCYLNIKCMEQVTTDPLRHAKAWIRLYWIYSDLNEQEYRTQAALSARDYYDTYLQRRRGYISSFDEIRVNAILGELSIAAGEYDKAAEYFERNVKAAGYAPAAAQKWVNESRNRYEDFKNL